MDLTCTRKEEKGGWVGGWVGGWAFTLVTGSATRKGWLQILRMSI